MIGASPPSPSPKSPATVCSARLRKRPRESRPSPAQEPECERLTDRGIARRRRGQHRTDRAHLRRQPPRLRAVRAIRTKPRADRTPARRGRRARAAIKSRSRARATAASRRAACSKVSTSSSSAAHELGAGRRRRRDPPGDRARLAVRLRSRARARAASRRSTCASGRCARARRRRTPISARCKRHALVFGTGPAGTGKTWLAVAHAVALFERKEVDRIILSRPAVEAGERLGFLPGDMREKVDPYLRPIYDALYDLMDARIVERAMQTERDRDRAARLHARPHAVASPSSSSTRRRTPRRCR